MEQRYTKSDFEQALQALRSGQIILYPTDTIWGIGCDATNEEAVARIYQLKQRSDSKSMLVLLDAIGKLQGYVYDVPETAYQLLDVMEQTDSRPLTIIYPHARNLASNLLAEDGSIGIRITNEPFTRALCAALHHPIVSTSANISGEATPREFMQISNAIREGVDYICEYRQKDHTPQKPSSIIQVHADNSFTIIRK